MPVSFLLRRSLSYCQGLRNVPLNWKASDLESKGRWRIYIIFFSFHNHFARILPPACPEITQVLWDGRKPRSLFVPGSATSPRKVGIMVC